MSEWPLFLAALLLTWAPVTGQATTGRDPRNQPEVEHDSPVERELIVVTASKREEQMINAPATMTVITGDDIAMAPSQAIADLLRMVPGVNVSQTSARDVNITSRGATGTLANSTLVLLDGRSIYQDFFGIVMWDFIPVDAHEIEQIEIIRGPASAVWGANAMTGVVNLITKTPRELAGNELSVQFGHFDRTRRGEPFDGGGLFSIGARHAAAPTDRFAYKVSGSLLTQEPFMRPAGHVPGTQTPYPFFENRGTTQPKLDARADYDFEGECSGGGVERRCRSLVLAGGISGTEGIMHSGLGPLDVLRGSTLKYGRITYQQDRLRLQVFVNALDGDSRLLLQRDAAGVPMDATFENQSYDVDLSNLSVIGTRHVLSYGGNLRVNRFDLSLAPRAAGRNEAGAYGQYEFFSDHMRWIVGTRVDRFGVVDRTVLSPRTTLIVKPRPRHQIRGSYNRAFRVPSIFNALIDTVFLTDVPLGEAGEFRFPSRAEGNPDIEEEALTAYELAYAGSLGPATLGVALYLNRTRQMILFSQIDSYTSTNPPPGWPLPPAVLDALVVAGRGLPLRYSYANFDRVSEGGIEVSLDARMNEQISGFVNYTWQADPVARGFPLSELNMPPNHRLIAGIAYRRGRYMGSASAAYQDSAFWQDVLDPQYHGWTRPYGLVNAMAGVRSPEGSMAMAVRVTNLLNQATQQHIFGDVIRRTVTGEVRFVF